RGKLQGPLYRSHRARLVSQCSAPTLRNVLLDIDSLGTDFLPRHNGDKGSRESQQDALFILQQVPPLDLFMAWKILTLCRSISHRHPPSIVICVLVDHLIHSTSSTRCKFARFQLLGDIQVFVTLRPSD
ncbi:hypothetical protein WG66_009465, partial [Moniliophthora roreri]